MYIYIYTLVKIGIITPRKYYITILYERIGYDKGLVYTNNKAILSQTRPKVTTYIYIYIYTYIYICSDFGSCYIYIYIYIYTYKNILK